MPLDFDDFFEAAARSPLASFVPAVADLLQSDARASHGKTAEWDMTLASLPRCHTRAYSPGPVIQIGSPGEIPDASMVAALRNLMPWRKGPWSFFGVEVDAEWRSDLKWARLQPHITPLAGRSVLDVGCGNGYYLLRMLAEGADFVLGVDPTLLYLYQFRLARNFLPDLPAFALPLKAEQLPSFAAFDTVFSMGVLYHRRDPMAHLAELAGFLHPGGELVLETLVVPGNAETVLEPPDRYAQMANVWHIPSATTLQTWLEHGGFDQVRVVDVTKTTPQEQRRTEWMTFQSLEDFLDPTNTNLTVEGLPAPTRAIVIARKATGVIRD